MLIAWLKRRRIVAKQLISDELWQRVEPLIPKRKRRFRNPGRKPIDDRNALTGIVFVLMSAIPWKMLPQEMGCGSGVSCWRRLRDWQKAGVWERLHRVLLDQLGCAKKVDWSRAVVDSGSIRAVGGGEKTGPNPTDRAKPGSKHHVITDAVGVPLSFVLTAANVNDTTELVPLVDGIVPIRRPRGRPRKRPLLVQGDRAYGSAANVRALRDRGIQGALAFSNTEHGSGLGGYRWVVERTISWLH